jgi:sortase B
MVLLGVLVFCGQKTWTETEAYRSETEIHKQLLQFKPVPPDGPESVVNQAVLDLQAQNSDMVGWLTVPGTKIDYPFVQAADNDFYLRRDYNGVYALAGTLFMDYRCAKDFTSQNTIIYGHHMKNGSMFGTLKKFRDEDFFVANKTALVHLPNGTLTLELFAYMVIRSNDAMLYDHEPGSNFLAYVEQNARHYRDVGAATEDRFVTLSTCAYEFNNARMVLVGRCVSR